ncbi:MAG: chloride channel protein [Pseudomonadota bacterium]
MSDATDLRPVFNESDGGRASRDWIDTVFGVPMQRLRTNLQEFFDERLFLVWLLALCIGIAVGYAAIAFRLLLGAVQWLWLGTTDESILKAAAETSWIVILLAPVIGGLIVGWLLETVVPGRRAQGVADVIEARALSNCRIHWRSGLWSAVTSIISLGFGASAGREGPVVHLGASIASFIEDRFQFNQVTRRTLLACGVAAAVSASFNAPIAGVLFAHEVILAHYALRAFVPIVISSVLGAVIVHVHWGNYPAFLIPPHQITSYWEVPAFALLGLTCAVVAILFELATMTTERVAWRFEMPLWLRPTLGGLFIGAIAVVFPQVLGVGYGATDLALQQKLPILLMIALIVAKTAATAITLASRFGGGVFSPALYLGAMTGGAFGQIAASVFPEMASSNGLYALLGMGGVAAAVLGAPISTTMIVFELTGGYDMTIALLLTVCIANGVTQAVLGQSFFHWQLTKRGLSLQEGPHKEIMRRITVAEFMIALDPDDETPVGRHDASQPWLMPGDTLERALRTFDRNGVSRIPVVSGRDETVVVGWADRLAALSAFNKALIESHEEEHR